MSSVSNGGWQRGHCPRAALGLMDTADRDTDRIRRQVARQLLAVRAVSDAVNDHGVDVEPEAERSTRPR